MASEITVDDNERIKKLTQYMLWLPASKLDIRPFMRSLKIIDDLDITLKALHLEHIRFYSATLPNRPSVTRNTHAHFRVPQAY